MSLTWKDLVTTILAAVTFALYYAMNKGISIPVISSYRMAILALGIIGIAMCAFSGGTTPPSGIYKIIASTIGVISLLLIVYGLITGTKLSFLFVSGSIIILWIISTVRHILGN